MVHKTGRLLVTMAAAVGLSILLPSQARAQGAGFQAGASVDPEQFFIGSHFETAPLVDRLHFRPGIDGGFGDGLKLATLNVEFVYKFPLQRSSWTIYQGGGPTVAFLRVRGETDVRGGVNALFGVSHASGFFTELKVGSLNAPNLKFGVGYTVRSRHPKP